MIEHSLVELRRAAPEDADWLVELYGNEDVDPFLGPRQARDRESLLAEIYRRRAADEIPA